MYLKKSLLAVILTAFASLILAVSFLVSRDGRRLETSFER